MMNNKNTLFFNNKHYTNVVIDTSSLLKRQFEAFMENFIPYLRNSGMKITVPQAVMREIRYLCAEQSRRGYAAKRAAENIKALHRAGLIQFEGNLNSSEKADAYIISRVIKSRSQGEKLLVITQDFQLCINVLETNKFYSIQAPANNVNRINEHGLLENFNLSKTVSIKPKTNNISNVLKRFGL